MDRQGMYHLYKDTLCRFGAIPDCEGCYENLIKTLLDVYFQKNPDYPKEHE